MTAPTNEDIAALVKRLREAGTHFYTDCADALTHLRSELEQAEDMANVGRALMETLSDNASSLNGWAPAQCPSEIVADLLNIANDERKRAESAERDRDAAIKERDEALSVIRDTLWMARRYADGRNTYAPSTFNRAARKAIALGIIKDDPAQEPVFAGDPLGHHASDLSEDEYNRVVGARSNVERLIVEEREAAALTLAGNARREAIEECAKVADLYADENIRLAGDTILHDPFLSGRSRSDEAFEKSQGLAIDGHTHSSMFHAAQNIAAAIRALEAKRDGEESEARNG